MKLRTAVLLCGVGCVSAAYVSARAPAFPAGTEIYPRAAAISAVTPSGDSQMALAGVVPLAPESSNLSTAHTFTGPTNLPVGTPQSPDTGSMLPRGLTGDPTNDRRFYAVTTTEVVAMTWNASFTSHTTTTFPLPGSRQGLDITAMKVNGQLRLFVLNIQGLSSVELTSFAPNFATNQLSTWHTTTVPGGSVAVAANDFSDVAYVLADDVHAFSSSLDTERLLPLPEDGGDDIEAHSGVVAVLYRHIPRSRVRLYVDGGPGPYDWVAGDIIQSFGAYVALAAEKYGSLPSFEGRLWMVKRSGFAVSFDITP